MADEQSGGDHSFLNNPRRLADKVSRFKLTDDDLGVVDFAKQGQERRMLAAAGKIGLQFVIAGTQTQLDRLGAIFQNIPREKISDTWQSLFQPDITTVDLQSLEENERIDGRFRVKSDDLSSPLIPGIIQEAHKRVARALESKVRDAQDPSQVAEAFNEHLEYYPVDDWKSDKPQVVAIKAGFWNQDNTDAQGLILPMKEA